MLQENEQIVDSSSDFAVKFRELYLCISIPGENNWVKEVRINYFFTKIFG